MDVVDTPAGIALASGQSAGSVAESAGGDWPVAVPPMIAHEQILNHMPLVESIARRIHGALPPHALVELHDLAQSGLLGLVNASRCYDPATDVPFSSYARYRIQGEILDSLRRHDHAPRKLRRWQKQVSAARRELSAHHHREPTEEELCDRLTVSIAELRNRNSALYQSKCYKADQDEHHDPVSGPDTMPDSILALRQLREMLDRLIQNLPQRHQQVILLYYRHHMNLKQIACELGVNESRVSQMHRRALKSMARRLRESGISSRAEL